MTLMRGKFIKDGGEGQIFEVQGHNDLLLKIYKDKDPLGKPIVTQELKHKLEYMKNHPPISLINNGYLAWPLDIYDSHGEFGFIMPKLTFDYPLLQIYAYKHPLIDKNYNIYPAVQSRIGVAINLAFTVSELHKAKYIIGDMNHENIGIDKKNGQVRIFDCDSFTITDNFGKTLRTNVCMQGYLAPEIIKHCNSERANKHPYDLDTVVLPTFTKESDLFCLAVHVFKSLMNGVSPFLGVDDNAVGSNAAPFDGNEGIARNNYVFKQGQHPFAAFCLDSNEIPLNIKSLFDRAFLDGNKNPASRPTAEEWYNTLSAYLGTLKQCSNNPKHQYYNALSQCPYCKADKRHYEIQYGTAQQKLAFNNQPIPTPIVPRIITNTPQHSNQWYNSQSQRTTEPFNKHKSPIQRNALIVVASVIIVLVIIWPKRTTSQKSTSSQYTSQTETQASSTNISNETFSTAKYVQTNGLHARSGPGTNYGSLFVVTQNSLVYLSDTSKSGVWVKIKYNNNVGWVNGTFLRDFIIKSVQIGNHDDDGYLITTPGDALYASQMKHLGITFDVNTINGYNLKTVFYLKIITPKNTYIQGKNTRSGYTEKWEIKLQTGSYGCGTYSIPSYYYTQLPGTWLIQIYYQNPKNDNTFDCIASKYFTLN